MNPLEFHESSPPRSQSIWSWGWGKMPVKGMTEASTITSTPSSTENFITQPDDGRNLSIETTNPIQTNEMNFHDDEHPIQLSLCGYKQYITSSDFYSKLITFEQLCQNPNVLNSHELVLRMNRKFYPSNVVGPIFASLILFQRPLPSSTLDQILLEHKEKRSSWRNWWNRSSVDEHSSTSKPPIVTLTSPRTSEPTKLMLSNEMAPSPNTSIFSTSPTPLAPMTMNEKWLTSSPSTYSESTNSNPLPDSKQLSRDNLLPSSSPPDMFLLPQGSQSAAELSPTTKSSLGYTSTSFSPTFSLAAPLPTSKYYHKSLRLTSDELKSLGLKKGCNLVTYTVHTPFQGIARCRSRIFLWDSDERVVISDIDGTITKSDALGHFFTMLGRDWTHSGVASLYTSIRNNGYQLLYLTSRAIGQAQFTRNYLNKVEQGQYQLPDGPVFLSPDRLLAAFTREVIQRRPEEFKIACLRDIRSLFHTEINPFHAGFGNRSTDAFSYRAVGVPANRIFHINANGEVRRELLEGYRATYFQLNDLVDQIFPPLNIVLDQEFNDWKFWKTEIPPLDIQEEEDEDEEEEEEEDEEEEEEGDEYDDENSLSNDGIEEKKSSMDSPSQSKNDVKAAHKLSNDTELDRVSEFIAYPYL
ncbi:hypothetical protein HMI55_001671 [Coelomomyces lativittatus]|nr:hypothetical protein HMI56_003465 [Coelomomyces lativittatus]KAJ1505260.1 hypothetical protein HMI55_001671 [Coelomomyces lativittatus]